MSSEKSEKKWYYAVKKEHKGPFPQDQFIDLIRAGTITGATFIYTKGFGKWIRAAETEMAAYLEKARQNDAPPPVPDDVISIKEKASSVINAVSNLKTSKKASSVMEAVSALKAGASSGAFPKTRLRLIGILCAVVIAAASLVFALTGGSRTGGSGNGSDAPAASAPTQAAMSGSDNEVWEYNNVRRPSHEELTDFVTNKIKALNDTLLSAYSISVYPSSVSRMPEIEVTIRVEADADHNEDDIDVLEYVMGLVGDYLAENEIDASEIDIIGRMSAGHEPIGWGHYIDGSFEWTANAPAAAQAPARGQPSQQFAAPAPIHEIRTYYIRWAEQGAVLITPQTSTEATFRYRRKCGSCGNVPPTTHSFTGAGLRSSFMCSQLSHLILQI